MRIPMPKSLWQTALAASIAGCSPSTPARTTPTAAPDASAGAVPQASDVKQITQGSGRTEVGVINGAPYRVDVPAKWNGELVLFCHGYGGPPKPLDPSVPNKHAEAFGTAGFAVAQSSYSAGGYAIAEAVSDTEALRRYFLARFGAAKHTWVTGESLGGAVTVALVETHPESYDGGLPMCAPLGPAVSYVKAIVFDTLVLFEYWFPKVLPSPGSVPVDYVMSYDRLPELMRVLDENPEASSVLRRQTTARSHEELAKLLDLYTYIMGELALRWGGNPFDNRNTVYTGVGDDAAVNDGVKRYRADPAAHAKIIAMYTPTGKLEDPMLAMRTVYDPIVSAFTSDSYSEIVQIAGRGELFVQKYTKGEGHCEFSPEERRVALQELRHWKKTGARPAPGRVLVPSP